MPKVRVNGVSLYYEMVGKGRETIVLSHGLLFNNTMFDKQIAHLKKHYRCIAYDHRGQGKSQLTKDGYDMDNLTQDVLGLLDALHIESCHFIGMAMGGFVGMRLAARHPNRIKSLILLETSADVETNAAQYNLMKWIMKFLGGKPIMDKAMNILFGQKFLNDPNRVEEKNKWREFLSGHKKSITKAVEGVINRKSIVDELSNIKAPTLVIVGEQDVAIKPIHAQQIYEQVEDSQFIIIGGAGHNSTVEEPEQVNQAIEVFLKSLQ